MVEMKTFIASKTVLLIALCFSSFYAVNSKEVGAKPNDTSDEDYSKYFDKAFLDSGNTFAPESRLIETEVNFFCIRSASNPIFRETFFNDQNIASKLNPNVGLTFIIHGWTDNGYRSWIRNMAIDMAQYYNVNACVVNWQALALKPYSIAAANTRIVGDYLTRFIQFLTGQGFTLQQISLLGHSMGAQICGFVGAKFGGQIPLIVGMDPAGWAFTKPYDHGIANRLDPTDAQYVQAIHTNDDFLGANLDLGHQDFYANTGRSPQPGCDILGPLGVKGFLTEICSHFRAIDLMRTMIRGNKYTSYRCNSYISFVAGSCLNAATDIPGINGARTPGGRFYFATGKVYPFTL